MTNEYYQGFRDGDYPGYTRDLDNPDPEPRFYTHGPGEEKVTWRCSCGFGDYEYRVAIYHQRLSQELHGRDAHLLTAVVAQ